MHGMFKNRAVKFGCILIFLTCLYDAEATLKTTFVEDVCRFHTSYSMDMRFQTTGILIASPLYSNVNCTITLAPKTGYSMVLSIYRYDVEPGDILTIEDSDRFKIALIGSRDFPDERKAVISEGRIIIYYKKNDSNLNSRKQGFQFTYTQVKNAPCFETQFRCKNRKCIPKELACNGHNHCGDNSNQKQCVPKNEGYKPPYPTSVYERRTYYNIPVLIGVIAGSIVLLAVIITLIVLIVRQAKAKRAKNAKQTTQPNASGQIGLQAVTSSAPGNTHLPPASPSNNTISANTQSRPTIFTQIRRSLRLHKSPQVEELSKEQKSPEPLQVPSMYPNLTEELPKEQNSPEPTHVPSLYPNLNQPPSAPDYVGTDNPSFERDH